MKFVRSFLSLVTVTLMIVSVINVVALADGVNNDYKSAIKKVLKIDESAICKVAVQEDGEYELHITFNTIEEATQRIEYAVKIDGEYPFEGAELLEAAVIYEDQGGVRTLSNGDQTAPLQKKIDGYITSAAYDKTGVRLTPYTVNLTAGEHTVEIENIGD